jgi:hypothetical protein
MNARAGGFSLFPEIVLMRSVFPPLVSVDSRGKTEYNAVGILRGGIAMFARVKLRGTGVFALAILLALSGCIFGPDDKDATPKEPTPDFRALTDKENVIHNLVESYRWADIEHYAELLHADYIWYNQDKDVQGGLPPFYTRAEDIGMTSNMFMAKGGTHPDPTKKIERMKLEIADGEWQQLPEIGGEPCSDCWETTRPYMLEIVMDEGNMTLIATALVKFAVVPVAVGEETLYKIYGAHDLND